MITFTLEPRILNYKLIPYTGTIITRYFSQLRQFLWIINAKTWSILLNVIILHRFFITKLRKYNIKETKNKKKVGWFRIQSGKIILVCQIMKTRHALFVSRAHARRKTVFTKFFNTKEDGYVCFDREKEKGGSVFLWIPRSNAKTPGLGLE